MKKQQKKAQERTLEDEEQDDQEEWLIGPQRKQDAGRKTLVLDLDETLVHS